MAVRTFCWPAHAFAAGLCVQRLQGCSAPSLERAPHNRQRGSQPVPVAVQGWRGSMLSRAADQQWL
eukprot:3933098-Rhodomonas_salina.3